MFFASYGFCFVFIDAHKDTELISVPSVNIAIIPTALTAYSGIEVDLILRFESDQGESKLFSDQCLLKA